MDPGPPAGLAVGGGSHVVPPEEPQGNQGRLKSEKKAVQGPKSQCKKTKFSQEIVLWLGLASGFMNSDQTIDKYC